MPEQMTEFQTTDLNIKRWDLFLKVVAVLLTSAGAVFAYNGLAIQAKRTQDALEAAREAELHRREEAVDRREKDFKLRYYAGKAEVYFDLCDAVARIALADPKPDGTLDTTRFYELLVGRLAVVGSQDAYAAALRFRDALALPKGERPRPTELVRLARGVTDACRRDLRDAFPTIGELPPPPPPK